MNLRTICLCAVAALLSVACGTRRTVTAHPAPAPAQVATDGLWPQVYAEAMTWAGTPYRYGGSTRQGADCSGLVMAIFRNALGVSLPRTSAEQATLFPQVSWQQARPGDLLFFNTGSKPGTRINHVGIYLGDATMLHASTSRGVVISKIDHLYYLPRLLRVCRPPGM